MAERLLKRRRVVTVGTLDGPAETRFGEITDIAVTPQGDVLVLDGTEQRVRVFGADGSYRGGFGRAGSGPGELRTPIAIEVLGAGQIGIIDRANGVMKLVWTGGDSVLQLTSWRTQARPYAACVQGDEWRVAEADSLGRVVRYYGTQGKVRHAVATGYTGGGMLARNQFSKGPIGCSENGVATGLTLFPIIQLLSPDGFRQGVSRIEDFEQREVTETVTKDGKPAVHESLWGDHVQGLVSLGGHMWLIQVLRVRPGPGADSLTAVKPVMRSFLFDGELGRGVYLGDDFPQVLAADSTRLYGLWGSADEPWPRLVIEEY